MLFRPKDHRASEGAKDYHVLARVRDIVEIVAIVLAGLWALYVFAYENRIKPALTDPDVNVVATLQRIGASHGAIAVGLHTQFRNIGTVKAHFLGVAVDVYGQRVSAASSNAPQLRGRTNYDFKGFYRTSKPVRLYGYGFLTHLGDPSTPQDLFLDPGTSVDTYRTFYVPQGTFDLATVSIDMIYTKYDDKPIPTHFERSTFGGLKVTTANGDVQQYDAYPVTSLDIR